MVALGILERAWKNTEFKNYRIMQSKKRKEFAFGGGVWGLGVGGRENLLGGGKFIVCMEQGKWGGGGVGGGGRRMDEFAWWG